MGCTSTPPHTFMVFERTILSQLLVKELVIKNRTDLQYILCTVRGDVNVIIRGTHYYNWVLKSQRFLGWVASSIRPPRIILSHFLKTLRIFQKCHTPFLKPSFSVSQTRHIVLPLWCTIASNTIFMHWACREFPFCFMTSSINFHFSSDNTDDFSGRE